MTTLPDWGGCTAVCIASGPSLTAEDCELVRASGLPTIVTNTTFRACPWASILFAFDAAWWNAYRVEALATFRGRLMTQHAAPRRGVECVRSLFRFRRFGNSGACAISLAISCGAGRVVMLGYDCGPGPAGETHHHGDHPPQLRNCDSIARWPEQFERLASYATQRGVIVLNASRASALTCFPRVTLTEALQG